ncbi:hypothetical protein [Mucilaginibacter sp.]|uniref:hypothetical protein n=1 Tax=Mucilaginibacter sp. TaxID=1882438 RepID=UPI003D114775
MKNLNINHYFRRSFLLAAFICGSYFYAAAQTAEPAAAATAKPAVVTVKGATSLVDAFFKKYKDDGSGPAIDYIFGTNKYFSNSAGITQLKGHLDSLRQNIGAYLGKELIVQKNASNSLVLYSYLVKHEVQPIRITFMFYKPKNDWVLYRFKYDDQIDAELEEAGKINNKRP